MNLFQLTKQIEQHQISLTLLPDGRLKPLAPAPIPAEVLEAMKHHKVALVRRLERGQRANGKYYLEDLKERRGCCGSCRHWQPFSAGDLHGHCLKADELGRHAAHLCDLGKWAAARHLLFEDGAA